MGKKSGKGGKHGQSDRHGKKAKRGGMPKSKCCDDSPKCRRCPLRVLKEGTLPPGYTVKHRRLVKIE